MNCLGITVIRSRSQIESDLSRLAPLSLVVGSMPLETGYELIVEGPAYELEALLDFWSLVSDEWQQLDLPLSFSDEDLPF